ncbi:uncharacterized protein LAESUDRAFT_315653 [Laetiporus sulphureus 93-53]|uniref:Uncharacterized protein n=1 Tax=Laetiporus sulphureus 93-53 TaxID=1314785 RepID=A0A165D2H0_9APHY|nr:uncharacterized protein LAESUDRAFT_315653 [Laetiporus sulphureus 93-53]KZT04022.1 hypothetical protein LAESUDRAFT_315653 [Laetiporus sulphureus 93-53]
MTLYTGSTGRSLTTATLTCVALHQYTHGISEVTRVKDRSSQGQRGVEVFRKVFRPERRGGHDKNEMQKAFNPFSLGLRTYVSRNLTSSELLLVIISSILR